MHTCATLARAQHKAEVIKQSKGLTPNSAKLVWFQVCSQIVIKPVTKPGKSAFLEDCMNG